MVSKNGEPLNYLAKIIREGEKVSLGNVEMSGITASFDFAPFYQAWGRPIPQAWSAIDRSIFAAAKL
jgi:hypothetical protein